jgi:tetratricopeptide (TPR) repeat protein
MGLALSSNIHLEEESRRYFEKAIKLATLPGGTLSVYGRAVASWGYFEEAKKLFQKALKKDPKCPFVLHNYQIFLLDDKNPEKEINLRKEAPILEKEYLNITHERISRYSRGLVAYYSYKP